MNPALLWSAAAQPQAPPGFAPWRDRLQALRPRLFRLIVDWSRVQPSPGHPPDWAQPVDGCVRGVGPCAPSAGIRDVLRALHSQQAAGGGFEVLVSLFGVPDWAARPPRGCEPKGVSAFARPVSARGLRGYRALIRSLLALGEREGVQLRWWSPWNEPNGPSFLSPQRAACDASAPTLAPAIYTRLARAMRAELARAPGDPRLVIGELAQRERPRAARTGIGEFFAALPDDVVCSAAVYAQHAYAERGDVAGTLDPVHALEAALDRRPCARGRPLWVTETGVGDAHFGGHRTGGPDARRADCRALDAALRRWDADPRVDAAIQYTFRDDPAFPVGVADAALTKAWPSYDLWLAWGGTRRPTDPAPALPGACAET
jgi:hypothetical protein